MPAWRSLISLAFVFLFLMMHGIEALTRMQPEAKPNYAKDGQVRLLPGGAGVSFDVVLGLSPPSPGRDRRDAQAPSSLPAYFASVAPENERFECGRTNFPLSAQSRVQHAFAGTCLQAYSDHYPLELSVSDFWVAISQGLAQHINNNPEQYRSLLVSHDGKKKLEVPMDDLNIEFGAATNVDDWPIAIKRMTSLIHKDMSVDLASIVTTPFSGTTSVEQTVFDSTLMETMKEFYEYRFSISCGLPSVTLHGSLGDWEDLIGRVDRLSAMFPDGQWWFDSMRPHLYKLLETAKGNPDREWWNTIAHKVGGGSDVSMLSGWLADFIPYVSNGKGKYVRARKDHNHYAQGMINGIAFGDFSKALTSTAIIFDNNGSEHKMKLWAGFIGVHENNTTHALRPVMGWGMTHLGEEVPLPGAHPI